MTEESIPRPDPASEVEDLRQENARLRDRLKKAADALHEMQAQLRARTEEGAHLRDTAEQLAFSRESLQKQLRRQSEAASSEIDRLTAELRRLEASLQSSQSESRDRARQLLKERLVDLRESNAARMRLEKELDESRRELSATQELLVMRRLAVDLPDRSDSGSQSAAAGEASAESPLRQSSAGASSASATGSIVTVAGVASSPPPPAPPSRPAAVPKVVPAPRLGPEEFSSALDRGSRLATTKSFERHDPVSRQDIRVSDWLRQTQSMMGLERLADHSMSRSELHEAVYRFYQRGWVELA